MADKMARIRTDLRMDPQAKKNAEVQAAKLGISTARFIELTIMFITEPERMDTWIEMLVAFKKTRKEMLKHAEKK